jgi:hypothetical protein
MFTFIVWVIGIGILGWMALIDFGIVCAAWEAHWFAGLVVTAGSAAVWLMILAYFLA